MASMCKFLGKLKLRINENKSKVTRATKAKFLGFSFRITKGRLFRRRVAPEAIKRLKERVRELTRRNAGRSIAQMCKPLGAYLLGWKAYFQFSETPSALVDIDGWVRHRLRAVQLKHRKRSPVIYRELVARGMMRPGKVPATAAAGGTTRRWRSTGRCRTLSSTGWESQRLPANLNLSNRPADPHAGWCGRGSGGLIPKLTKAELIVPNLVRGMEVQKRDSNQTPGWSGRAPHNTADGGRKQRQLV
jgi:Group II intron, maturase-specific domain